ncbi:hypothetical protein [Aliikangiella sp. IMCC44359]|uniref:hypothetical protein n=1 Tax=Aliikangiella sp. IMCC44359 TaxID=3459125 RepID=UPI00403AE2C7
MKKFNREEIRKKIEEAEKEMIKKGQCPDCLGEAIDKADEESGEGRRGILAGPKNEVDHYRILREIRKDDSDGE